MLANALVRARVFIFPLAAVFASSAALLAQGPPVSKSALKVAPDTVYLEKTGSETTLSRKVNVNRTGPPATIGFTAVAATSSGGSWLAVTPLNGTAPADLTITATPGSLAPGSYNGTVTVTPTGTGQSAQVVNVILRILSTGSGNGAGPGGGGGAAPAVLVRPSALNFQMAQGAANPLAQTLTVSSPSGGAALTWSATAAVTSPTGGKWLQITPTSGTGGGSINVTVNGAGLAAGRYAGTVAVTSGGATSQVQVGLNVGDTQPAKLVIDPRAFNFIVQPNGPAPSAKTMRVKNTGSGTLNWTASATSTGGWLKLTPASGATPADLSLTVNAAGLAGGMYEGSVKVTAGGATETARVFLRIVGQGNGNGNGNGNGKASNPNQSALQISPRALEFTASGSSTLQLTSKLTGLTYTATRAVASGATWLSVSPGSGVVPGAVTVTVNATGVANGVHTGVVNIAVQGAASEQRSVPVTLRVGGASQGDTPRLSVKPGAVVFQASPGGANPAAATVNVEASGGAGGASTPAVPFTTTISTAAGGNWLAATPSAGTTPATVTVTATTLASLQPGTYKGAVVFTSSSTGVVAATLNINFLIKAKGGAATGMFLEPGSDFAAVAGSPQAVSALLLDGDGAPLEGATVDVFSSSSEGGAPFRLEDAGDGLYTGLFQSFSGGPVSLTAVTDSALTFSTGGDVMSPSQARPVILEGGIVNAANFSPSPTPLAPGSIATLFGRGLATDPLSASSLPLPKELGGLKILAGGVECALIGVVPGDDYDQVNFVLPAELNGVAFADIVAVKDGAFSAPEGIALAPALPAVFTADGSGAGPAAALHADYSPLGGAGKPAVPGETILLFATGLGELSGTGVETRIGGLPARTSFAGLAPGFVGLYQLNVVVPDNVKRGADAALGLAVGGVGSGEGVLIPIAP